KARLVSPTIVPPGESATILVELDHSRIRPGEHFYNLQVDLQDGGRESTFVRYNHLPRVIMVPHRLSLEEASLPAQLTMSAASVGQQLRVVSVESSLSCLSLSGV